MNGYVPGKAVQVEHTLSCPGWPSRSTATWRRSAGQVSWWKQWASCNRFSMRH